MLLVNVKTVTDVRARVDLLVADIKACAEAVVALDAKVEVDASLKADIAVRVAAIITIMVKACVDLSAKFGLLVLLSIFAKIDLCLKLLLVNLGVCVDGIIVLIANIVAKIGAQVFVNVRLDLCVVALGLLKL